MIDLKEIFPDDVFFVSYPKSGNTWIRFVLANYLTDGKCYSFASNKIIPGIHSQIDLCNQLTRPRYMQSHFPFQAEFKNVIYIVRDCRDVAVSYYYHYLKTRKIKPMTPFVDFLDTFNKGNVLFGLWNDHVNSWLDNNLNHFLLVRYEDVLDNQVESFEMILRFMNIDVDLEKLQKSLDIASFKNMRHLETKLNKTEKKLYITNTDIPFVRKGIIGDYKNYFNSNLEENLIRIHGRALKRLKYI
jgi:hypothetical protein